MNRVMLRVHKRRRRRCNARHTRSASLCCEELQTRLVLSAAGFAGNDCQPDLDLSGLPAQVVVLGETLTIDLLTAGATATDNDSTGAPTNDALRFQLDPDVGTDTPVGATISDTGVLTWTPTADQLGEQSIMILLLDAGSPVLADSERLSVTVTDMPVNQPPELAAISDRIVTANQLMEIMVSATDPDSGDTLAFDLDTIPPTSANIEPTGNGAAVVRWTPTEADGVGPVTFRVIVTDDGSPALEDQEDFQVSVQFPPSVDLNGDAAGADFAATFSEGADPTAIVGPGLTVTDLDSATLDMATVKIENFPDGADEMLSVETAGTTIADSYDPASGELTLSGNGDSPANFQRVLRTLTYQNLAGEPTPGDRSVITTVSDDGLTSEPVSSTVSVVTVNDAPTIVPIDDQQGMVGSELLVDVSASDADSAVLTFSLIDSPSNANIIETSSTTATIQWTPGTAGDFEFQVQVADDGDPVKTASEQFTVAVSALHAAPVIDLNGDDAGVDSVAAFVEDGGPVNLVTEVLTVSDADNTELAEATVTITNLADGDAELLEVDVDGTGVAQQYDSNQGVLTLTGPASLATFEAILETLAYDNNSQNPDSSERIIEVRIDDETAASGTATISVSVSAVNDPPSLASVDDQEAILGEPLVVNLMATDVDSETLTYTLDDSLALSDAMIEVTGETTSFVWTPSEIDGPGIHTVRIEVADDGNPALMDAVEFDVLVLARPLLNLNHADSFGVSGPLQIAIARQMTVTDLDSPMLAGAAITLADRLNGSEERLHINTDGTAIAIDLYDEDAGTLVLAGADTVENYQQVLRTLEYSNDAADQTPGTRLVQIKVVDETQLESNTTETMVIVQSPSDGNDVLSEAEAANLDVGQTVTLSNGQLENGGDVDFFSVDVLAGQTLIADVTGTFTPAVRIFDVDGVQVSDPAAIGSTAFVAADAEATYYVGVSADDNTTYEPAIPIGREGSATGIYDLTLSLFESGSADDTLFLAEPITVRADQPLFVTSRIDPGSDVDFFAVALNADEVFRVDVISQPDADVFVRIFDARGMEIGVDADAGTSVTATLDSVGGTVYVGVSSAELTDYHPFNPAGRSGTSVTDYQIRLQRDVPVLAPPLVDAVMASDDILTAAGA